MSRRTVVFIIAGFGIATLAACAPKATHDECTAACKKKVALEEARTLGEAAPGESVASVEAEFQQKIDDLENQKTQSLQALDQELQAKLAEAKDEQEKASLTQEYTTKKDEKAKEFQPLIDTLNQQKIDAVKAAQEKQAQAEEQKRLQQEAAVKACADSCLKARTTRAKAACQANAGTLEDFNACR